MGHFGLCRLVRCSGVWIVTMLISAASTGQSMADDAPGGLQGKKWLTRGSLRRALDRPVDITWANSPLRQALNKLGAAQKTAVLLDRRIDPDQRIELTIADAPLRDAWRRIASKVDAGATQFGPVMYIGPKATGDRLRTVALLRIEGTRDLPDARRKILLRERAWRWDDLSKPRELLAHLASEGGLRIEGLESVPHDLWAAADLPPLALADRFTLIAAAFDLTYAIDKTGQVLRLIAMPTKVTIVRDYDAGRRPETLREKIIQRLSADDVKISDGKLHVRGRIEDHEMVATLIRGDRPATGKSNKNLEKRYTIQFKQQPLGRTIKALARQLKLELDMDDLALENAGVSLEQRISVAVTKATLDELLKAVLRPVGLGYRLEGRSLVIRPAEK